MIADERSVRDAIADLYGSNYEPATDECDWCARETSLIDLHYLSVADEPVDEDLMRLCPTCHPDKEADPGCPVP